MSAFEVIVDDDFVSLTKILKSEGLEVLSSRNSKGETLLHRAATYGSIECTKLCCLNYHEDAFDLLAVNTWNETALHLLAASGEAKAAECCKVLLECAIGNNDYSLLTKEDQWGRTPMSVVLDHNEGKDQKGCDLQPIGVIARYISAAPLEIQRAVRASMDKYEGKQKEIIEAERQAGASIIVDRDTLKAERGKLQKTDTVVKTIFSGSGGNGSGITSKESTTAASMGSSGKPLSSCLEYPVDLDLLKALVAKGGDEINVSGKDSFGLNILHKLAAWNASADAFFIVLPSLDESAFRACDMENDFTPLHHTLMSGNLELAKCLLAHNPDLKHVKSQRAGSQSPMEILMAQPSNVIVDQFRKIFY